MILDRNSPLTNAISLTLIFTIVLWGALIWLFLAQALEHPDTVELTESRQRAYYVLLGIAFAVSLIRYGAWEIENGTAFSYWFPMHGHRRVDDSSWRLGIFVRTEFLTVLLQGVLVVLFRHDYDSLMLSGVPIFTKLTTWEILLYTVCQVLVDLVLLLYLLAGQYYTVRCGVKPLLAEGDSNKRTDE